MADTKPQAQIHEWIRSQFLPQKYGQTFSVQPVRLSPGGERRFAAVSADGQIVGCIRTSEATTSAGKRGVGKFSKIVEDIYYLTLIATEKRLLLFTDSSMAMAFEEHKRAGKIPDYIEGIVVSLPPELREKLRTAQRDASREAGG